MENQLTGGLFYFKVDFYKRVCPSVRGSVVFVWLFGCFWAENEHKKASSDQEAGRDKTASN